MPKNAAGPICSITAQEIITVTINANNVLNTQDGQ